MFALAVVMAACASSPDPQVPESGNDFRCRAPEEGQLVACQAAARLCRDDWEGHARACELQYETPENLPTYAEAEPTAEPPGDGDVIEPPPTSAEHLTETRVREIAREEAVKLLIEEFEKLDRALGALGSAKDPNGSSSHDVVINERHTTVLKEEYASGGISAERLEAYMQALGDAWPALPPLPESPPGFQPEWSCEATGAELKPGSADGFRVISSVDRPTESHPSWLHVQGGTSYFRGHYFCPVDPQCIEAKGESLECVAGPCDVMDCAPILPGQ